MSGRSYPNNVNGRGNGAAGRGSGTNVNSTNYGVTNAVPGTSGLQGTANTFYYSQPGHSYHVGPRMVGNPYYPPNNIAMGTWQQNPPTGSTLGATTSTSSTASSISSVNNTSAVPTTGTPTYAHVPVHVANHHQYMQGGYRPPMPQQHSWIPQGNAAYISPAQIGMMTSTNIPNASFPPTASTVANTAPPPRERKIPTITVSL